MRIVYMIDTNVSNGGAPISTMILAKEMARMGHEVFVLMPVSEKVELSSSVQQIYVTGFHDYFPFLFTNPIKAIQLPSILLAYINEIKPDIIHCEMPRGARAVGCNRLMGKIKGIPLIYTDREHVIGLKKIYRLYYGIFVAKQFDSIVCLSNIAKNYWDDWKCKSVTVIPNPGGEPFDSYKSEDLEKSLRIIGHGKGILNILFVGRMVEEKRWWLAEKIVASFPKEYRSLVNFLFAISYVNNEMKKEVDEMESRLSLFSNVTFYRNLNKEEINLLYYSSDIHVITSRIESFGRTAIEAMSRKNIVISTDAGAISETIGDKKFIVDPQPETFQKQIIYYCEHQEELKSEQEIMYHRYLDNYRTESIAKKHVTIYRELINNAIAAKLL